MTREEVEALVGTDTLVKFLYAGVDQPELKGTLFLGHVEDVDESGVTIDVIGKYVPGQKAYWKLDYHTGPGLVTTKWEFVFMAPQNVRLRDASSKKEALWPFGDKLPKKFEVTQACLCDAFGLACTGDSKMTFEKTKDGWTVNGQLSPLTDGEAKVLLKNCQKKKGSSRTAVRARKPKPEMYLETTPEQFGKMSKKEFYGAVNEVTAQLMQLKALLDVYEAAFSRMREGRLLDVLEEYQDEVAEFQDVVMQLSEASPRINYKAVVEALVAANPRLAKIVAALEEEQKEGPKEKRILKYPKVKEPGTWTKRPHRKLGQGVESLQAARLERMLRSQVATLRSLRESVEQAAFEQPLQMAASIKGAATMRRKKLTFTEMVQLALSNWSEFSQLMLKNEDGSLSHMLSHFKLISERTFTKQEALQALKLLKDPNFFMKALRLKYLNLSVFSTLKKMDEASGGALWPKEEVPPPPPRPEYAPNLSKEQAAKLAYRSLRVEFGFELPGTNETFYANPSKVLPARNEKELKENIAKVYARQLLQVANKASLSRRDVQSLIVDITIELMLESDEGEVVWEYFEIPYGDSLHTNASTFLPASSLKQLKQMVLTHYDLDRRTASKGAPYLVNFSGPPEVAHTIADAIANQFGGFPGFEWEIQRNPADYNEFYWGAVEDVPGDEAYDFAKRAFKKAGFRQVGGHEDRSRFETRSSDWLSKGLDLNATLYEEYTSVVMVFWKAFLKKGASTKKYLVKVGANKKQLSQKDLILVAIKWLSSVDFGKPSDTGLRSLERASDLLKKIGIKPVDVDLAISEFSKDPEKAKKYISGPSGRGSNKGAIRDLQTMIGEEK